MSESGTRPDVLKVQGRLTLGYGIIPKMIMKDYRLTIEAKAIYSYFCSYAGAGTTAFPSRDKILHDLQISKDRFYKHFNLLKQFGYIEVVRNTDSTGKFQNNIYTLIEMIEPCQQNKDTDKKPCPDFPYTEKPDTDNPYTENKDTIIISLKNNSFKNNSFDNQQSESTSDEAAELHASGTKKTDMTMTVDTELSERNIFYSENEKEPLQTATPTKANGLQSPSFKSSNSIDDYTAYRRLIQDNIDYSHYLHNRQVDIELIDELINCMLDVICTKGDTVKINGEEKSRNMVISQYLKINSMDIEHIIERYTGQHHKITHLHSYLKTMLYTIKQEHSHYYTNAVRADGVVW